jgi:hypothetical protein
MLRPGRRTPAFDRPILFCVLLGSWRHMGGDYNCPYPQQTRICPTFLAVGQFLRLLVSIGRWLTVDREVVNRPSFAYTVWEAQAQPRRG